MARMIYVKTFLHPEDPPESSKIIDHDDHSDRVWLGRHCFWAFRNGRHIQTGPADSKERD